MSVADYAPSSESQDTESFSENCQKLASQIARKVKNQFDNEKNVQGFLVFNKNNLQYHSAPLLNQKYHLICVYPKHYEDDTAKKGFMEFHERIEFKISHKGAIDESRLTLSLTQLLSEQVEQQNEINIKRFDPDSTQQSTDKLQQIEIELEDIANNVKQNISDIFERGEKFGVLASKSEQLKSSVSFQHFIIFTVAYFEDQIKKVQ
ncbi:UNKNOWN [Stylonychia lemnae]|uniref:V-SNARE coiled-coil homology domain-containing protein n=1 Tax=Stylonychia lemnae TaxID=5949 RepID=A0A078AZF9_STYLE|nr:UNKNOWN [Stylonychia lemnae]|eukprot:CDW87496.1 UNKNOWN [Stylonychia lemnae]